LEVNKAFRPEIVNLGDCIARCCRRASRGNIPLPTQRL